MNNTHSIKKIHHPKYTAFIASVIFSVIALITCFTNSVFTGLFPKQYTISEDTYDDIGSAKSVSCLTDTLYYSGYDYYVHGKIVAHYYYSLKDDACTIFLIDNALAGGSDLPSLTLSEMSFSANIRHGDTYLRQLLEYMASDLDWNYYSLSKHTNNYIISQYHYNMPWLIFMIFLTAAGIASAIFFYISFRKEHKKTVASK